jgi:hypothetical protein
LVHLGIGEGVFSHSYGSRRYSKKRGGCKSGVPFLRYNSPFFAVFSFGWRHPLVYHCLQYGITVPPTNYRLRHAADMLSRGGGCVPRFLGDSWTQDDWRSWVQLSRLLGHGTVCCRLMSHHQHRSHCFSSGSRPNFSSTVTAPTNSMLNVTVNNLEVVLRLRSMT